MKYLLYCVISLFVLASCKSTTNDGNDGIKADSSQTQLIQLQNKVAQLEMENSQKDSVINNTLEFFSQVQSNLARIDVKENEIRVRSNSPELNADDKKWILQEIQNINFLRKQNAETIRQLRDKIDKNNNEINEFKTMIERLVKQIKAKDKQIELLKKQLAEINMEYSELLDDYNEQVEMAYNVIKEMNTVYYAYGTIEELTENNVLVRKGGFLGIGRKTKMSGDLNQEYFKKLDKRKINELTIVGEKPEIITDHPVSSYEWNNNKLIIKDVDDFWRVSNYLVIVIN